MAARRGFDTSRAVSWLRIILPLAGLGLISSLFLLSRGVETDTSIPFSQIDLRERVRNQQATAPLIAGQTDGGDLISFTADSARPDLQGQGRVLVVAPVAQLETTAGGRIVMRAANGALDNAEQRVEFSGDVVVETSGGFVITTDGLIGRLQSGVMETTDDVQAKGPMGQIEAGHFQLRPRSLSPGNELVFTRGVKLIYNAQP